MSPRRRVPCAFIPLFALLWAFAACYPPPSTGPGFIDTHSLDPGEVRMGAEGGVGAAGVPQLVEGYVAGAAFHLAGGLPVERLDLAFDAQLGAMGYTFDDRHSWHVAANASNRLGLRHHVVEGILTLGGGLNDGLSVGYDNAPPYDSTAAFWLAPDFELAVGDHWRKLGVSFVWRAAMTIPRKVESAIMPPFQSNLFALTLALGPADRTQMTASVSGGFTLGTDTTEPHGLYMASTYVGLSMGLGGRVPRRVEPQDSDLADGLSTPVLTEPARPRSPPPAAR